MRSIGRPRVLVCDDEEAIRQICAHALTRAGYESHLVANGAEALAAAREQAFDVFLLDVRMPDLDGPEVLERLRELDPDTPCVVISAHADLDDAIQLLRRGASDFVPKPFDLDTIVKAVDRVLSTTHLQVDSALLAATRSIFASLDPRETVQRVLHLVRTLLRATEAAIVLTPEDGPAQVYRLAGDPEAAVGTSTATRLPPLGPLLGGRDPVILRAGHPADAELVAALANTPGTLLVQRLAVGERPVGLLCAARAAGARGYGEADLRRAMLLAGHAALALENATLHDDVEAQARRLQQAHDRLVVAERIATVARLATGLGHEIANPATAVLAYLELARKALGGGRAREVEDALERATAGANAIIDVCQALRPLASGSTARDVVVDLQRVLDGALLLAAAELRDRARVVRRYPPGGLPPIVGDPAKLGQVFLNLLLNSAQAIAPGRAEENEVAIEVEATATDAIVTVRDTGKGIAPDLISRLFQPNVTTKTTGPGHGMGLAICRWILEEAGGSIRCVPVSRGAAFEVRLPSRGAARRRR